VQKEQSIATNHPTLNHFVCFVYCEYFECELHKFLQQKSQS